MPIVSLATLKWNHSWRSFYHFRRRRNLNERGVARGGMRGIVVGWFTSADSGLLTTSTLISLPFALAFLTGYGIDILFNALDKLQRAVLVSTSRHR